MRRAPRFTAFGIVQLSVISAGFVLLLADSTLAQSRTKPTSPAKAPATKPAAKEETQPEPTTAAAAQALLDLTELSRINAETVFEDSPTYVSYHAKAGLPAADAFYQATLEAEGWKPAGSKPYATAEYADRLFQKDGYYLRVSIGKSEKLSSINLSHLGNVDVRKLPRHEDAALAAESTPVNLSYTTKIGMAEALKYCQDQLAAQGWKEYGDPSTPPIDVPHVKMAYFRKNDARVQAVIYRDPQKLEEGPTSVSWLSMSVVSPDAKKPPVAALTENRTPRGKPKTATNLPAEAEDPPVPVPAGKDDDDDLAERIQREVKAKLERELKKLGKDLGDLGDLGLDGLDKPAKPKGSVGKSKGKPAAKPNVEDSLPRDEPPAKASPAVYYLAGPCKGYVSLGDKRVELKHAIAVQYQDGDEATTAVYCADKPLKTTKFKRGNPDNISLFDLTGFDSNAALSIRMRDGSTSINCSIGGGSLSISSSKIKFDIASKEGRLKGQASLPEPEEFFDKKLQFEVNVDLPRDTAELPATPTAAPGELQNSDDYDLPLPGDRTSTEEFKSPYRGTLTARFPATLDQTIKFYRKELPLKKYVENVKAAQLGKNSAELAFTSAKGPLRVSIKSEGPDITVELITRNEELAKQHGMAPKAGMAKLILGNTTEAAATVVVDGKTFPLKAGEGTQDPKSAQKIDLKPGKHTLVITTAGKRPRTEEIEIPADGTWGLLVGEDADFSELFY